MSTNHSRVVCTEVARCHFSLTVQFQQLSPGKGTLMIRKTRRMVAVTAAALLGTAMTAPAASANSSAFATSTAFSTAGSSNQQEYGVVSYDAVGGTEGGIQAGSPFAASVQMLVGSLGMTIPGGGGHQPPTGVHPKADIFFTGCADGLPDGFVRYDNNDSIEAVEFSLRVNGNTVDSQTVPAESEVDGVTFSGVVVGTFVTVLANGEEVASLDALPCEVN